MRGIYASTATPEQAAKIVESLGGLKVEARVLNVPQTTGLSFLALNRGAFLAPSFVMLVLMILAGAVHANLTVAAMTVRTVNGNSPRRAFAASLGSSVAVFAGTASLGVVLAAVALYAFNGLAQFTQYVATYGLLCAMGLGATLVGHLTILVRVRQFSLPALVDGKRPLGLILCLAAVIQAVALAGSFVSLSLATRELGSLAAASSKDPMWLASRGAVSVRWSSRVAQDEFETLRHSFAKIVRTAEANNKVVLTRPSGIPSQRTQGYGPENGNSVTVNDVYLRAHPVLDEHGRPVDPPAIGAGEIHLLIPSTLRAREAEIVQTYQEWISFQSSLETDRKAPPAKITTEYIAPSQEIFNYGASPYQDDATMKAPVVAVTSARSGILSDDYLLAASSTGGLLFTDGPWIVEQLTKSGLMNSVAAVSQVSDMALQRRADRLANLRVTILGSGLLLVALVLASLVFVSAYSAVNAKRIFIQQIHGFTFWRIHGSFMAMIAGIGVVVLMLLGTSHVIDSLAGYVASVGGLVIALAVPLLSLTFRARENVKTALARA